MDTIEYSLKFCRICAQQSAQTQDLFEIVHNNMFLSEMLMYCLRRSNIQEPGGLPTAICATCKTNLVSTYDFLRLCETSEKFLLETFSLNNESNNAVNSIDGIKEKNELAFPYGDLNIDIGCKCEPKFEPELICVDENFGDDMITEESYDNSLKSTVKKRFRNQNTQKVGQRRRKRVLNPEIKTIEYFECFECKEKFDELRELRAHIPNHMQMYECSACKSRFSNDKTWKQHCSQHTEKTHSCELCDQIFKTVLSLRLHTKNFHKDHLNDYSCDKCPKTFALQLLLTLHNDWHKTAKEFPCPSRSCNEIFYHQRKLKAHFQNKHAKLLCSYCGKLFSSVSQLTVHQTTHTTEKAFACSLCPCRYKKKGSLQEHMRTHIEQKRFTCDICESSLCTKYALKQHQRIHTNDRRYQCEICSMRFYSKSHLTRHIHIHTGEKPYACSYCSRSFRQSNDLTKHIRSHIGPNIYKCDCGASFRLQSELRKHSSVHYTQ